MNVNNLIPPAASPNRAGSRGQDRGGSRAGGRNMGASAARDDDPNNRFRDRFTNIHSKNQIEKQREFDENKARLMGEFAGLDRNGDGVVTYEELYQALCEKDPEGNYEEEVARHIFEDLD